MSGSHLAQINVATALYPKDDSRMAGFMNRLEEINALAERTEGFVWRLKTEAGDATDIQITDDPLFLVNMSVWTDVRALFEFTYRSGHQKVMSGRRQWFERPSGPHQALWWIPAGYLPPVEEGLARLGLLEREGPTPAAFTFKTSYPPPEITDAAVDLEPEPYCAGWS